MTRIACFLIEPTAKTLRALRRYRPGDDPAARCPGPKGYHDGQAPWDGGTCSFETTEGVFHWTSPDGEALPLREDPHWPSQCSACSYLFQPDDQWQMGHDVIYLRRDTGEAFALRDALPGAMWWAPWYARAGWCGSDGRSLVVRCPPSGAGNDWCVDAPSTRSGSGWTRSGEPPRVTAAPSILFSGRQPYHGYLRDGWLEAC